MPRISEERREARRGEIVDAARRCFARRGFHQTSMPELLAEAGVSAGAFYRYFASKDEVILEIAGEAFRMLTGAIDERFADDPAPDVPGAMAAVTGLLSGSGAAAADDLLRCGVQAWGEALHNPVLRARIRDGFERVHARVTEALASGQRAGRVPAEVVPGDAARLVLAVAPGLMLQRAVFGHDDPAAVLAAAVAAMTPTRA